MATAKAIAPEGYNTVMPWWSYSTMTEEELGAMWDFFHALPKVNAAVVKFTP